MSVYDHDEALAIIRLARQAGSGNASVNRLGTELGEELAQVLFGRLPDVDRKTISRVVLCLAVHLTEIPPTTTVRTLANVTAIAADVLDAGTEAPR